MLRGIYDFESLIADGRIQVHVGKAIHSFKGSIVNTYGWGSTYAWDADVGFLQANSKPELLTSIAKRSLNLWSASSEWDTRAASSAQIISLINTDMPG